mmetsp:Transcript_4003/g.10926  ORF Transcript_4003/g.10926 Transcript_4003/m.10926 type:complete len:305 (-) Transcript_4003:317-1231(-)
MTQDDADDDLDAFFDDVEKVADETVTEEGEDAPSKEAEQQQPPTKKQKTENPPPVRPRGVVVAAASSSSYNKKETPVQDPDAVGPALPPPNHYATGHPSVNPNNNNNDFSTAGPQPQYSAGASTTNAQQQQQAGASAAAAPKNHQPHVRTAGGKTWVDTSLDDWPDDDFRIFVGNLCNAVTDVSLYQHFSKYPSLQRAKVVRDTKQQQKNNNQQQQQHEQQSYYQPEQQQQQQGNHNKSDSKGYGFVSFGNALECAKAIREMDQSWLGDRPIRIKRSTWKDREIKQVRKKQKNQKHHQKKMRLL